MQKTAILTINYNSKKETLKLLKSLENLEGDFELFLLENGSAQNGILKSELPQIKYKINYFASTINLGFAGGNNLLIKQAENFDFYWLLNNDCLPSPKSLKSLISTFSLKPKAGLAESVVLNSDNKIWFAGSKLNLKKGKIEKLYYGKNVDVLPKQIYETDEINGAAMLIKKEVIEKIGFLDETFFHTAEDTDYSLRAKKAGFELYINPKSNVIHGISKSSGGAYSFKHMYYVERGRILLMKKYNAFSLMSFIFLLPIWIKRILAPAIREGNFRASIWTIIGIWDGILGKNGRKF